MIHSRLRMCAFAIMMMSALLVFQATAALKVVSLPIAGPNAPDFAFPEAVATDAAKQLERSLTEGDWLAATRSVIDLTIAKDLRDKEDAPVLALRIDSMAQAAPKPYGSLLQLLEARLYADMYTAQRRIYDARTLPEGTYPESPFEWSGQLFRTKIAELTTTALSDHDKLISMSLKDIAPLVENSHEVDYTIFPSVLDFAVYRAVELFDVVSDSESARRALSLLTTTTDSRGYPYTYALTREAELDHRNAYDFLVGQYEDLGASEASMLLIDKAYGYINTPRYNVRMSRPQADDAALTSHRKTFIYNCAKDLSAKYPDSRFAPNMHNIVAQLGEASVNFHTQGQFLSTDSLHIDAECRNLNDFIVDLYRLDSEDYDGRLDKALKKASKVASRNVSVKGKTPFEASTSVDFPPQTYGKYFLVACDASGKILGDTRQNYVSVFTVSDLAIVTSLNNTDRTQNRIYVVSARNQKPVRGAKVTLSTWNNRGKKEAKTLTTNADGYVPCGVGSYDIRATLGKDVISGSCYASDRKAGSKSSSAAQILTDLSIYHPGDSIGFVAVVYEQNEGRFAPFGSKKLTVTLEDANNQEVGSQTLTTDASGRASGTLAIPASGLAGSFTLTAREGKQYLGSTAVQVAEYKAPTFYVELSKDTVSDGSLVFTGSAKTFSGIAIAGGTAQYNLKYVSWWLRSSGSDESMTSGTVQLDDKGEFVVTIPRDKQGAGDVPGYYVLTADVTSPTGETQSAVPLRFSVGEAWRLEASIPSEVEVQKENIALTVNVLDVMGNKSALPVDYKISDNKGKVYASGSFTSPTLRLDARELPSGKYIFEFVLQRDTTVRATAETIVYRLSDKCPPMETPLWVPQKNVVAERGADTAKVVLGSGYKDSWLLVEVADGKGFLSRKWMRMGAENKTISVPAPRYNERIRVYVTAMHNLEGARETIVVSPYEASVKLGVEISSFRDKIVPGAQEHWSFRFTEENRGLETYAMAVLTDKALNNIAPFRWSLAPLEGYHFGSPIFTSYQSVYDLYATFSRGYTTEEGYNIMCPDWQFYGYQLFPGSYSRPIMYMSGANRAMSMKQNRVENLAECTVAEADYAVGATADAAYGDEGMSNDAQAETPDLSDIAVSDFEHPLAFFRPDLTSDGDGNVAIGFEVPDYNTTWQLQLLGYDRDMRTALLTLDAVSSKAVMVSINAPRFLRTGDVTEVTALVSNSTSEVVAVGGVIEIVDPATGEVLHRHDYDKTPLEAGASRVISIDYAVPYDREMVIVRAYALSEGHSDGEQVAVAILPSSQPVIEADPFYLAPDQHTWSMTLPNYAPGSQVSLSYCANPVWLCVTSLPDVAGEQSASVLSKARALYANALSRALVKRNPSIEEAIKVWSDAAAAGTDSTLYSNLQRNRDLKSVMLENTPWVQDASGETTRMMRLKELLDGAAGDRRTRECIAQLQKLQNADGGWSWCPSMRSSFYITTEVLRVLGQLKEASALPEDVSTESLVAKGAIFCEDELCRMYEASKHVVPVESMCRYLYAMTPFVLPEPSQTFRTIKNKALDDMQKNWRRQSVGDLATTAVVLWKEGRKASVPQMLESLCQRAVYKKSTGMHYANLEGAASAYTPLLATARVLHAYALIDPHSVCIDRLRQWIVMQKQAQMWDDPAATVEVVSALLSCGSEWIVPAKTATVRLGGKTLELPSTGLYTGEFVLPLDASEASGAVIEVTNDTDVPSWGGVLSSRIAPMKDVKSTSTIDLKVQKQIFVVENGEKGRKVEDASTLATGQRVRITLTLTNSRDIEYVALTDPRAACMEPVDQLSKYTAQDGLWMYRETRNSATDLFIEYLPKGTHVVSYDCFVNLEGRYASGVATAQSIYAPTIVAHTDGSEVTVVSRNE